MTGVRAAACLVLALVTAIVPQRAQPRNDLGATVDRIRAEGCGRRPGVKAPLQRSRQLDRVAESLAEGMSLREAMKDAGYRALRSTMLEVTGSEEAIPRALADRGCAVITDPEFREAGYEQRRDGVWLVLAAPLGLPDTSAATEIGLRVFEFVNGARATPRRCGARRFDPAPPLAFSAALARAAAAQARDMAARGDLSHRGDDGSSAGVRVERAGYDWQTVGENIAAGQLTAEQVVADWVKSPRHCATLMGAEYVEMGVAYAESSGDPAIYWAQVFASPRSTRD
jgi:Cysteine-rich secretory protein family